MQTFLQRNLQQCPRTTKELCYRTLVQPSLDYASVIRDPFAEDNIWRLEMVQCRAACVVFSDHRLTSSVSPMLQQLQWPTLHECRAQAKIFMMYCIIYNLVATPVSYLMSTISVRRHNMRPRKINVLFPISSPICHRVVGRQLIFFSLSIFFPLGRSATYFVFSLLFSPSHTTVGEL